MVQRRAEGLSFDEIREIVGKNDPLVLEIGANNGHSTLEFLAAFPNIEIHCFEPDPRAFGRWKNSVKDSRATMHEMAIGAETGTATFNMSDGREDEYEGGYYGSGSLRPPKSNNHPWLRFDRTLKVPVQRLDDWVAANLPGRTIDFIWADVQGAEVDLINGGRKALKQVRWFFTEFNDRESYVGQIPLAQIQKLLSPHFKTECVFPGDVLLRNAKLVPKPVGLFERGTVLQPRPPSTEPSLRRGSNGVVVSIPRGMTFREGKDGQIVVIPPEHTFRQGNDGRVVAIPVGHGFRQGKNGRMVAIPPGHSFRENAEGQIEVLQPKTTAAQA